jgi:hypothetical protein
LLVPKKGKFDFNHLISISPTFSLFIILIFLQKLGRKNYVNFSYLRIPLLICFSIMKNCLSEMYQFESDDWLFSRTSLKNICWRLFRKFVKHKIALFQLWTDFGQFLPMMSSSDETTNVRIHFSPIFFSFKHVKSSWKRNESKQDS